MTSTSGRRPAETRSTLAWLFGGLCTWLFSGLCKAWQSCPPLLKPSTKRVWAERALVTPQRRCGTCGSSTWRASCWASPKAVRAQRPAGRCRVAGRGLHSHDSCACLGCMTRCQWQRGQAIKAYCPSSVLGRPAYIDTCIRARAGTFPGTFYHVRPHTPCPNRPAAGQLRQATP